MSTFSKRFLAGAISVILVGAITDRIASFGHGLGQGLLAVYSSTIIWISDTFIEDLIYTVARVTVGFFIAMVFGFTIGSVTGALHKFGEKVSPTLNFIRAITPVALSPFFLMAFGIGELSKVSLIAWGCFFPIWLNTHLGLSTLSLELISSARLYGLIGFRGLLHFWLPAAFQSAYPGARLGVGSAYILVFISESLGASHGIGFRLGVAYDTVNIPLMCAALLVLGALGLMSDRLIVLFVRIMAPWIAYDRRNKWG